MVRTQKTGLRFFPLQVDIFEDPKIMAIAAEYGVPGQIVVIRILCEVYRNGYWLKWNSIVRYKIVFSVPGLTPGILDDIVRNLVSLNVFDRELYETESVLTSRAIQRRWFAAVRRRQMIVDNMPYLMFKPMYKIKIPTPKPVAKPVQTPVVIPEPAPVTAVDTAEPRIIFKPPTVPQVREVIERRGYHFSPNMFVDFYQSKGWMVGKSKMKDWKAALSTWERRYKTQVANKVLKDPANINDLWKL